MLTIPFVIWLTEKGRLQFFPSATARYQHEPVDRSSIRAVPPDTTGDQTWYA